MAKNIWRRVATGGEDHVRRRLDCLGRSLGPAALEDLSSFPAGVWTVVPEDTPQAAIVDLLEGLSASVTVESGVEGSVIDWLLRLLRADPASAVIFGVIDSRSHDRHLRETPHRAILGVEAYTVITGPRATFDVFRWNITYVGAAVLVRNLRETDLFESPGVLRPDLPEMLSGHVAAAIVEAYDDEGVLVWPKDVAPSEDGP